MNKRGLLLKYGGFALAILIVQTLILGPIVSKGERNRLKSVQRLRGAENSQKILFLGDSTIAATHKKDKDKRSTATMLNDLMKRPPASTGVLELSHAAYHSEVYLSICEYVIKNRMPFDVVIIPVNIRSFSPVWDQKPEWRFEEEQLLLDQSLLTPHYLPMKLFRYPGFNRKLKDFHNISLYRNGKEIGRIKDFKRRRGQMRLNRKNRFLIQYLLDLPNEHPKLLALAELSTRLHVSGIRPIFYITPIDYQSGEFYFGNIFTKTIRDKCRQIKASCKNAMIIDLSLSLPHTRFAWLQDLLPNEHLNEKGRAFVAEKIYTACTGKGLNYQREGNKIKSNESKTGKGQ